MESGQKKQLIAGVVTLIVVIGGILGLTYGGRMLWGSRTGETCDSDFSCTPGGICISKRCRQGCKADKDCPTEWSCRGSSVSVTPGGNASKGFKFATVNICFSPEAMAPVLEKERLKALEKKKGQVRLEVIVSMTTTPPQLTDAEFDAAWRQIPPEERASAAVRALANRVIAVARQK